MEEIDLKDFLVYLKKFIVLAVFVLAGTVAGTYFYDTQLKTPMYSSYTTVVLAQRANSNAAITQSDITVNQLTYDNIVAKGGISVRIAASRS